MNVSQLEWIITLGVTLAVLLFDVIVIGRRPHEPTIRECAIALSFYVGLAGAFRRLGVVLPRQPVRGGVLRRLAHRVQPVGGQPVHLPHHHGQLQRAQEVPAAGAAGRHHPGADLPRHLHRARRGGDQPVLLDLLHLRRVPGVHRRQPGPRHRARRRRRERGRPVRAEPSELHRQVGRPQARGSRRTASG